MTKTNKNINRASPLKAGFWYTVSNFLVKGMAFLTTPFFTRIMTSSDIGQFSNITTWITILAIVVTFELSSSVSIARFDYKDNLNEYISSNLILGTIITGAFYVIILIFHNYFESLFDFNFEILNIVFIYLLVYPAIQMFQMEKQIKYAYLPIIIVSLGSTLLATCCSFVGVFIFPNQLVGRVAGYYFPMIAFGIGLYIYLLSRGKRINTKYWGYGLKVSLPLIFHLLAAYLLTASDRLMITRFISREATAYYSVAYSCGMVVSLLWSSLNGAWSPWAYQMMDLKDYNQLKKKSKIYSLFFLYIVLLFVLIGPDVLLLMGGSEYMQAVYVIPAVSAGYIFQFLYSFFVNIEFYSKKQVLISIGTIIAAIINIVLNLLFIPKFGYLAAAYTTLAGYICLFLIHLFFVKILKKSNWYSLSFFFAIGFISLLMIPGMFLVYEDSMKRYCFVGLFTIALIVLLFMKRKSIIFALKHRNLDLLFGDGGKK